MFPGVKMHGFIRSGVGKWNGGVGSKDWHHAKDARGWCHSTEHNHVLPDKEETAAGGTSPAGIGLGVPAHKVS